MTAISWTGAASDHLFTTAANWSTDTVPGAGDDVSIGGGINVQDTAATVVNSIALGAGTIFEISNSFTATNGTGAATSSGTFFVDNGQSFFMGGTFNDTGLVSLNSSGSKTTLALLGSTTLQGGGAITLSANANNTITYAGATSATLTNSGDTISGVGSIGSTGAGLLTIVNGAGGVINANATTAKTLSITANGGLTNMGLIESSASGVLSITAPTINNTGGTISGATITNATINNAGGTIGGTLVNSTLIGGAISSVSMSGTSTVDGDEPSGPVTVTQGGTLNTQGSGALKGEIDNAGAIRGANWNISGSVTLTGTGVFIGLITGVTGPTTDILTNVSNQLDITGISNISLINEGIWTPLINFNPTNIIINNSIVTNDSNGKLMFHSSDSSFIIGNSTLVNNGLIEIIASLATISVPVTGDGNLIVTSGQSLRVCFEIHEWAFRRMRLPPMATRIMAWETSIRFS